MTPAKCNVSQDDIKRIKKLGWLKAVAIAVITTGAAIVSGAYAVGQASVDTENKIKMSEQKCESHYQINVERIAALKEAMVEQSKMLAEIKNQINQIELKLTRIETKMNRP